ncbi:GH-E family nuclease [Avibacterium paragallinarum]|uniref:GH-E family nuclease n=1 Tax=Avibacterium paragallinarum TaxID=728 RepID=UPI002ED926FE
MNRIGHIYGWEHRRLSLAAKELKMTQKEFNDYINAKADKFRLENRFDNRSHKNEMSGNEISDDLLDDMKTFLDNLRKLGK